MSSYSGEKWEVMAGKVKLVFSVHRVKDSADESVAFTYSKALAHRIAALPELEAALREIAASGEHALTWCQECIAWKKPSEIHCLDSGDVVCAKCDEDVTASTEWKLADLAAKALPKPTEVPES